MTDFFAYLLKLAVNQCNGRLIKNILVTVEEVNQNVLKGIKEVLTDLGYQKDDIRVISHSESFVYYTLNQNKDIWINKVLFLELNEYEFACRRLEVVRGREPHVADVKVEDLSNLFDLEMAKKDIHSCDRILAYNGRTMNVVENIRYNVPLTLFCLLPKPNKKKVDERQLMLDFGE